MKVVSTKNDAVLRFRFGSGVEVERLIKAVNKLQAFVQIGLLSLHGEPVAEIPQIEVTCTVRIPYQIIEASRDDRVASKFLHFLERGDRDSYIPFWSAIYSAVDDSAERSGSDISSVRSRFKRVWTGYRYKLR